MDYRSEAPDIIRRFLVYHETIKGHSKKTVEEYYLDLRTFFRFLKQRRGLASPTCELDDISISDIDLAFVKSVTLSDIYDFLSFLSRDRATHGNSKNSGYGLNAASRARKISTIRSYYKYLNVKEKLIDENPVKDLDSPKLVKTLPRYLTLEESLRLLQKVDGKNSVRDYCILTLFLNCGLRISELIGLNLSDVRDDSLRVLGKGSKERIVYLNEACLSALQAWLPLRHSQAANTPALFISSRRERISRSTVHNLVKKHLEGAGLDSSRYSAHKLRHTAATLMLQNGVDVRTLQELLGHEHLNTTQIYTHVENDSLRDAAMRSPLSGLHPPAKPASPKAAKEAE